jgi:hypothetical protein
VTATSHRKIETNSREAIFALGQPYKVAAPLAGIALGTAPHVTPPVTKAPEPTPAPVPTPAPTRALIGPPVELADARPEPVPAPPSIATTAIPASTSPAPAPTPTVTAAETPPPIPMPGETPGGVGHFDLPHDAASHARAAPAKRLSEAPRPAPKLTPDAIEDKVAGKPARKPPAEEPKAKPDVAPVDETDRKASGKSRPTSRTRALDRAEPDGGTSKARGRGKAADDAGDAASTDTPKTKPTRSGRKQTTDDADAPPPKGRASSRKAKETDKASAKSKAEAKAEKTPVERVYVQIAGGANKADMDKAWSGVKTKAPELMRGKAPSTTPLHATNRLLVGPFKDEDEAQAFVNKMAGKGLSGFTFKSVKGQKVEKLGGGN